MHGENSAHADVKELSYEEARAELVELVRTLESGQVPLAETIALWERGEALAGHCRSWLDDAQAKLEAATAEQ
ncbi:MAG: exodeoxyribonuclease VII small subunit [Buchananella hordeovulneris]|nr:exodeoxyribonuclease VII small subunit [Buchananella hordeovulneris]